MHHRALVLAEEVAPRVEERALGHLPGEFDGGFMPNTFRITMPNRKKGQDRARTPARHQKKVLRVFQGVRNVLLF